MFLIRRAKGLVTGRFQGCAVAFPAPLKFESKMSLKALQTYRAYWHYYSPYNLNLAKNI